jgi:hypothetical protein
VMSEVALVAIALPHAAPPALPSAVVSLGTPVLLVNFFEDQNNFLIDRFSRCRSLSTTKPPTAAVQDVVALFSSGAVCCGFVATAH